MTLETYNKSVDILLDAYNEGKLFHGHCNACAVGNLLGTRLWGCEFTTADNRQKSRGKKFIGDFRKNLIDETGIDYYKLTMKDVKEQLSTLYQEKGFTREELMQIEYAFEAAIYNVDGEYSYEYYKDEEAKEGQYLGLVAVLKVMETMVEEPVQALENMTRLQTIAHDKYQVVI